MDYIAFLKLTYKLLEYTQIYSKEITLLTESIVKK